MTAKMLTHVVCVCECVVCIMSGMKDWSEIHQNDHSENLML